jgi:hypothetical protein
MTTPTTLTRARPLGVRGLPVTVDLVVTVTVDPTAWDREYATGTTPDAIRADLAAYLTTALSGPSGIWPALHTTITPGDPR